MGMIRTYMQSPLYVKSATTTSGITGSYTNIIKFAFCFVWVWNLISYIEGGM
jgi:hypothetical protein